ncbi:MAG: PD40 domain-containing protein [Deltaproteobacteria bacterium]|nr:PD40 domain-containing protein [Deltaproteobacteria bacterium]
MLGQRVIALLAAAPLGGAVAGCTALWGVDELGCAGPDTGSTSSGGGAGSGGTGGTGGTGGSGAKGGSGGGGGAGGAPCELGSFGPASLLTELSSTGSDWDPAISAGDLTIVWSSNRSGGLGQADIWFANRDAAAAPFGAPNNLGAVNSTYGDMDPELSPDELTIFWAVGTPNGTGDMDIWYATRTALSQPFGTAAELPGVNSSYEDRDPALSVDGLTLFFASTRPGGPGSRDIWTAKRSSLGAPFGAAQLVAAINTDEPEANPSLSSDGLTLFYDSSMPGGFGSRDIWFVARATPNGTFGTPQNVGLPNTGDVDSDPAISADGRTLYFASNRPGGAGNSDLWQAQRSCE